MTSRPRACRVADGRIGRILALALAGLRRCRSAGRRRREGRRPGDRRPGSAPRRKAGRPAAGRAVGQTVTTRSRGSSGAVDPESGQRADPPRGDPRLHEGDDDAVRAGRPGDPRDCSSPATRSRGRPARREAGRSGPGLQASGPEGHQTGRAPKRCRSTSRRGRRSFARSRRGPGGGRAGPRLRHDRPGRQAAQALRTCAARWLS